MDPSIKVSIRVSCEFCVLVRIEDATGSTTALQFEALDVDRVAVPLAVMYVDHNVLQIDDKTWTSTASYSRSLRVTVFSTHALATVSHTASISNGSPDPATATALRGEITDPRELGNPPSPAPAPSDPNMDDRQILDPPPEDETRSITVARGLTSFPARGPTAPREFGGVYRNRGRRLHLDGGHGPRRGSRGEPLVEHTRVCEVHVPPSGLGVP